MASPSPPNDKAKEISSQLQNLLRIPSTSTTPPNSSNNKENLSSSSPVKPSLLIQDISDMPQAAIGSHLRLSAAESAAIKENYLWPGRASVRNRDFNVNRDTKDFVSPQSNNSWNPRRLSEVNVLPVQRPRHSEDERESQGPNFSRLMEKFRKLFLSVRYPEEIVKNMERFVRASLEMERPRAVSDPLGSTIDPVVKSYLRQNAIIPVVKRNQKFPRAKFWCACCNYHIDTIYGALEHFLQARHCTSYMTYRLDCTLHNIPAQTPAHWEAIGESVIEQYTFFAMSEDGQRERAALARRLQRLLNEAFIDGEVSLFGSSVTGLGFEESDVNINITIPVDSSSDKIDADKSLSPKSQSGSGCESIDVSSIVGILKRQFDFLNVTEIYNFNKVSIDFDTKISGKMIPCHVQFNNGPAVMLANLIHEYCKLDAHVQFVGFAMRLLVKKASIGSQDDGYLPTFCYSILVIHHLQKLGVIPVLHTFPHVDSSKLFATADEVRQSGWRPRHDCVTRTIGEYFLALLRYFATQFEYKDKVITISRNELERNEKCWNRKLNIEDPIIPMSNLARSAANNKACENIIEVFRHALAYFAIPRTIDGPLYNNIVDDTRGDTEVGRMVRYVRYKRPTHPEMTREIYHVDFPVGDTSVERNNILAKTFPIAEAVFVNKACLQGSSELSILKSQASLFHNCLSKKEYSYSFQNEFLPDGRPPQICKACSAETHSRKSCPEEVLPVAQRFDYPTLSSIQLIYKTIMSVFENEKLVPDELAMRQVICNEMSYLLQRDFVDAQFTLYGSSRSGFELRVSDVDICMTLSRYPEGFDGPHIPEIGQAATQEQILQCVVDALHRSANFKDIHPITSAKVPIIKFRHRPTNMEGDVSLYNILALHNTQLLNAYSRIDPRVKVLGCFLKKLMKTCDISDASKGTLSSYAYVLMLIHYLQQRNPPVLPVLQQLKPCGWIGQDLPSEMKEGCNIYFFTDQANLPNVWPQFGKNVESVAELWIGFLQYYNHEFNFEDNVITISKLTPLSRKEKLWFTGCISIEDPFEKNHNLGSGLSKRMSVHILKTLQQFNRVFHTDVSGASMEQCIKLFCSTQSLKQGNLPIDRQCRICYRIGHIARNCPGNSSEHGENNSQSTSVLDNLAQIIASGSATGTSTTTAHHTSVSAGAEVAILDRTPMTSFPGVGIPSHLPTCETVELPSHLRMYQNFPYPRVHPGFQNLPPRMPIFQMASPNDGYSFFWDAGTGGTDMIEELLIRIIQSSSGVDFGKYVEERLGRICKQFPSPIQSSLISIVRPRPMVPMISGGVPMLMNQPQPNPYFHPFNVANAANQNHPIKQLPYNMPLPLPPPRMTPPGFAPLHSHSHPQNLYVEQNYLIQQASLNGNGIAMLNGIGMELSKQAHAHSVANLPANCPQVFVSSTGRTTDLSQVQVASATGLKSATDSGNVNSNGVGYLTNPQSSFSRPMQMSFAQLASSSRATTTIRSSQGTFGKYPDKR